MKKKLIKEQSIAPITTCDNDAVQKDAILRNKLEVNASMNTKPSGLGCLLAYTQDLISRKQSFSFKLASTSSRSLAIAAIVLVTAISTTGIVAVPVLAICAVTVVLLIPN